MRTRGHGSAFRPRGGTRAVSVAAALVATLVGVRAAQARDVGLHQFDPKGKVRGVRAADVDGDGRTDLVLLVEPPRAGGPATTEVVVLKTPATPDPRTFFRPGDVVRIPCDGPAAGRRATAGAVAIVRLGHGGKGAILRFLGDDVVDVSPDGTDVRSADAPRPTLLGRSAAAPVVFWDAVADLDGDGRDECWYPDATGRVAVGGLSLAASEEAQRSATELVVRKTRVPALAPADVDGDGSRELVRLDGTELVVERPGTRRPATRIALPFLAPDPARPPEEIRSPRLTLADVDADGKTDLLVTLVQGRADKVGGLRTSLYHYPGPFVDATTGGLVDPRGRLDTESVALHPRFVDVTGDGRLDYVADSIRGTTLDLVQRVMGKEPTITFTVFRFDARAGAYERSPYATFELPYSAAQARGNTFGPSGFFDGDFDGDGVKDMLDLGNLTGVAVWRGGTDEKAFTEPLVKRVPVDAQRPLAPDAVIADLNGDRLADAVVWNDATLFLVVSKGAR